MSDLVTGRVGSMGQSGGPGGGWGWLQWSAGVAPVSEQSGECLLGQKCTTVGGTGDRRQSSVIFWAFRRPFVCAYKCAYIRYQHETKRRAAQKKTLCVWVNPSCSCDRDLSGQVLTSWEEHKQRKMVDRPWLLCKYAQSRVLIPLVEDSIHCTNLGVFKHLWLKSTVIICSCRWASGSLSTAMLLARDDINGSLEPQSLW